MNITFPHLYLSKLLDPETVAKKRRRGICVMHRCRRVAEPGKTKCHTCQSRLKRIKNPLAYAFENLKRSAAKRGIGFELTRAEFADFCKKHGYLERKGREPESMTIHRIRSWGPYHKDNIRPLSMSDNASHRYDETPIDEI